MTSCSDAADLGGGEDLDFSTLSIGYSGLFDKQRK
jgi:hypothetical protein